MNNKIIFDASAVVALLAKEKGFAVIKRHLKNAIISSVNISEVYKYCVTPHAIWHHLSHFECVLCKAFRHQIFSLA